MPWKKGKVRLADGSVYHADLLIENGDEVWNMKLHSDHGTVEEIVAESFASKLNKTSEQVYPFTYQLDNNK
ncbi:hypothetical protein [Alkaliphilus hydrothermalis]|uniref:Uncharacterized protein n=1 Tax=Alkaliphilus hydrothermalis TaxID=1482730 RepID=A0ABS2NQB1_9FIRM|nr:hypothetical protein [Alkaliphilus hydrothermalis]MBM7614987.1 hypothetical protein [Alkaliphilus hydrothermalis]